MGLPYAQTTCPHSGIGCSFNLFTRDSKKVSTAPDYRSPINKGTSCPKGTHARQFVDNKDRLKTPLIKRTANMKGGYGMKPSKTIVWKFKTIGRMNVSQSERRYH